ncbi:hypothetical protein DFR70_10739 [Nocardia tenerifensis]|uniref:Uncharacterized protein n=1 Tax=Nocardia tenerifensis TaxID=228006 RepID=A0A318K2D2_9NOCA|nr:hypothetical protein [Nocardia tenerifensis]PXX62172.1 hypothetical protein DFR70_10739 [Nocardia tenerifensis]
MYVEELCVAGPLTAESAEGLASAMVGYTARITLSSNGSSVQLPNLPWCWDVLRLRAGSVVTVTVEHGRRPGEDRIAMRAFVARLRALTGA